MASEQDTERDLKKKKEGIFQMIKFLRKKEGREIYLSREGTRGFSISGVTLFLVGMESRERERESF